MPIHLDEFFPDHASWPFIERSSNATLSLNLSSRMEVGRRLLELNDPPDHHFQAFFDRMTITNAGLELNRVRLQSQTFDIRPPLVITTGEQLDHVGNLFPGISGSFPMATAPYDGSVTSKHLKEIPTPGSPQPDLLWEVRIASHAREGTKVFEGTYQFTRSGLISYMGQIYGNFFIYQRTDIAAHTQPEATHLQAAPPRPQTAPSLPPASHSPGQQLYVPYHDRISKEVWDAEHDDALLARLRKRAKDEPELNELLKRRHLLEPKQND